MTKKIILSFILLSIFSSICQSQSHQFYTNHFMNISHYQQYSDADTLTLRNPVVTNLNSLVTIYLSDTWHVLSSPARLNKKRCCRLGIVLAVGGLLYAYDREILDSFHRSWDNPVYKSIIKTGEFVEPMGQIEKMNPYCIVGFAVGYAFKINRLSEASIQIIESLTIASGFKYIIREAVGRARPSENMGARFFKFGKGESFPSGHTSNAFQVATILSQHVDYLPFRIACYGLATTVGLWRIDVNLHWASDVFFGAVYGTAVSSALLKLHEKRKLALVPVFHQQSKVFGFKATYKF